MVKPTSDGNVQFSLPVLNNNKIAIYSAEDTGLVVSEILKNKENYLNKRIAMTGDYLTPDEIASVLSKRIFINKLLQKL